MEARQIRGGLRLYRGVHVFLNFPIVFIYFISIFVSIKKNKQTNKQNKTLTSRNI